MPQRWTDQYMSTWGSVPPSCRDVYFNYLFVARWRQSSPRLGPNIHPHGILEGLGNLPRRDIYTFVCSTDASYHIVSSTVKKTLSRQHFNINDSLLRFQIRVCHDRLKCKQMFLEIKFLQFSPQIDWIIQLTSSPGNLTFLWSSGSEPGEQPVQSNVVKFLLLWIQTWMPEVVK